MNSAEANRLLAHAAAFDNRNPSAAAAEAWAAALHDVPLDADALAAVARFYGTVDPNVTGQKWIQPHHVRAHRRAIRDARLMAAPVPPPHHALDERGYREALKEITARIGDGKVPFRAIAGPDEQTVEPTADFRAARESFVAREAERQAAETTEEIRTRQIAEAYGYLLVIPAEAADRAFEQARGHLGSDADRHEVVLLAARLADAKPLPPSKPDKATADLMAAQGCPNGCPLGEHVKPCHFAEA